MTDFIEEGGAEDFERQANQVNELIHRVFVQNEDGAKLLEMWKQDLIMTPSVQAHYTQFEAGIAEGAKHVIRRIINAIKSVET